MTFVSQSIENIPAFFVFLPRKIFKSIASVSLGQRMGPIRIVKCLQRDGQKPNWTPLHLTKAYQYKVSTLNEVSTSRNSTTWPDSIRFRISSDPGPVPLPNRPLGEREKDGVCTNTIGSSVWNCIKLFRSDPWKMCFFISLEFEPYTLQIKRQIGNVIIIKLYLMPTRDVITFVEPSRAARAAPLDEIMGFRSEDRRDPIRFFSHHAGMQSRNSK